MTWKEARTACLKWMYAYSRKGAVVPETAGTNKDLALAMPEAANAVLHDIRRVSPDVRAYIVEKTDESASDYDFLTLAVRFCRFDGSVCGGACEILPDGHTLRISGAGTFPVWYHAFPAEITAATADETDVGLRADEAVLLPPGMAAELLKEDDAALAATLWNEYAQRLNALGAGRQQGGEATYTCTTGWL